MGGVDSHMSVRRDAALDEQFIDYQDRAIQTVAQAFIRGCFRDIDAGLATVALPERTRHYLVLPVSQQQAVIRSVIETPDGFEVNSEFGPLSPSQAQTYVTSFFRAHSNRGGAAPQQYRLSTAPAVTQRVCQAVARKL